MTAEDHAVPIEEIRDPEVAAFAKRAEAFLQSHKWCERIVDGSLAFAVAGVLGVFDMQLVPRSAEVDSRLWVVVGDLPPAYLVRDEAKTWQAALAGYVYEMGRWVTAVRDGASVDGLIPVNTPPTSEYAEMLSSRLDFIQRELVDVPPDSIDGDT